MLVLSYMVKKLRVAKVLSPTRAEHIGYIETKQGYLQLNYYWDLKKIGSKLEERLTNFYSTAIRKRPTTRELLHPIKLEKVIKGNELVYAVTYIRQKLIYT